MINFKLMKFFIFLCFHVHKNSQINHFNSIFKNSKFGVLHCATSLEVECEINKGEKGQTGEEVAADVLNLMCDRRKSEMKKPA